MVKFSSEQLELILGYYLFENRKNENNSLNIFSDKFNTIFNSDFSSQIISYAISIFKNLDTSLIAKPILPEDKTYSELWKKYVTDDNKEILKKKYNEFKKGLLHINNIIVELDDEKFNEIIQNEIIQVYPFVVKDEPKELYIKDIKETHCAKRDVNVSLNALRLAKYRCEYSSEHKSFIRKNSEFWYTEGHHLIPLKYQYLFKVNLDVEANVVSLCSNCHNNLHYGKDYEIILSNLFNQRKNRLEKCGIHITLEELINMYK